MSEHIDMLPNHVLENQR
jgi:hypothetical protein